MATGPSDIPSERSYHGIGTETDDDAEVQALLRPIRWDSGRLEPSQYVQDDGATLPRTDSRERIWSPYLRDLHMLSFAFLFVFIAYCAIQNLESSINTDQGLGSASLGVLYLSLMLSSFGAPLVVKRFGSKLSLVLGLSGYWAFIGANLYPSWLTLIPAAAFLGVTASVLWVAEGTYLTFAAKGHANSCNITEAAALGNFNGEFWSLFSLTQVVGNLLTLVMLELGGEADSATKASSTLIIAFLCSLAVGSILIFFLRPHFEVAKFLGTDVDRVLASQAGMPRASFALLMEKKMLFLTVLLCYTGVQQAFIWGDFTKDIITARLGLVWVGGIMAAYGASDTLASMLAGRISSGLGSITAILCGGAVCQMFVLAVLFFKDSFRPSEVVDSVILTAAAIMWGIGDATFNTQISAILGIFYPHDVEAAFAQWKIWQSAGTSVVFFASEYVSLSATLVILFGFLVLSIALFFMGMARWSGSR